jgi:hypothetical protein
MTQKLKIEAGKYYRTRDGRKVGPMVEERPRWSSWPWDVKNGQGNLETMLWKDDGMADETPDADLIAEWQDAQPAHIITHEGRTYNLTALETPFGLLPDPVQVALKAWPHGHQRYASQAWIDDNDGMFSAVTYRAKPAPTETRVQCQRREVLGDIESGTCIKRDGQILWDTWELEDG